MDRYGYLDLKWSVGYDGSQLQFITDDTLVYACGNTLSFVDPNGKHVRSLQSEGSGVTALTVCSKAGLIAYAEKALNPRIFIINYPTCTSRCNLAGGAVLKYSSLSFSDDGKKLVSLSGIPDFMLTVWDCSTPTGSVISNINVGEGATEVSVNPIKSNQILLFGPSRLTLWNIESCDTEKFLSPIEIKLPEKVAEVGTKTSPVLTLLHTTSTNMLLPPGIGIGSSGGLFTPPNMSEVYYKGTYEDFVNMNEMVEMKSYCWTPKQTLYVGCSGGQLLSIEFDTGTATVLVNSHPPLEEETDKDSCDNPFLRKHSLMSDNCPTAHALLKEGSIDSIALSRKGLFVTGKNGWVQCFSTGDDLKLLDQVTISHNVSHLVWSPNYSKLAIGSDKGAILTVDPLNLSSSLNLLSGHPHSKLNGLDMLCPGSEYFVTCRSDGDVQVWNITDGALVSSINLGTECTCISCPLSCQLAVVGVDTGHLCIISLVDPTSPSLLEKKFMHSGSVTTIRHDQAGFFMMSASTKGPVFFYNSRPSSMFAVLGYIDLPGSILDVSLLTLGNSGRTQAAVLNHNGEGDKTEITYFQLNNSIIIEDVPTELYEDASKKFSRDYVNCSSAKITENISTVTLVPGNRALGFLDSTFELVQFSLPQGNDDEIFLDLKKYKGHDLDGEKLVLSFHQKWAASVASDGKLFLRLVESPDVAISSAPHHYSNGGCYDVVCSRDGKSFLTIGDTGRITCWKINYSDFGERKGWAATEYFRNSMKSLDPLQKTENLILESMPQFIPPTTTDTNKTWYMQAKEEARKAEDAEYSEIKDTLRQEISSLRDKVLNMITSNEELPEIEKLGRQEFILDTEDYQKILAEEEKLIAEVKEDIELSNLATMFTREQIKRECWDNMAVKGKIIKTFQGSLEVSNYPMTTRSEAKMKELEKVKLLRGIEIKELEIRKEVGMELERTLQPLKHNNMLDDEDLLGDMKEKQAKQLEEEDIGDPDALLGSHRGLHGGEEKLLASQFRLHSQVCKKHQIVLLENCIYKIKTNFNEEFDQVMRTKVNEISRIKEKNIRISKIISQLKLDDALIQPSLSVDEEPERLLLVDDSEIKIEKYVSPEENRKVEEVEALEEEKRLAAKGDNPRERALDMMMGGRLEINVEEDLFKDLPRPDVMAKDPTEMSEEEILLAREFQKKEEAFLEEREKLKKALEAELRKLQVSIVQGMEQFDERLQKLFQLKIKTQTAIHQDELKINHMARSLFIEQEVVMRVKQLNDMLMEKKGIKVQLGAIISTAKEKVDTAREIYETLAAEDREFDRSFKRDFADCEPYVDQLYKLFRKRPRGQKLKAAESSTEALGQAQNMFAGRRNSGGSKDGDNPMAELDRTVHMLEGMDLPMWERFIAHRHKKVESEMRVKAMALELAEMNSFLQKRQMEESRVQLEIQNGFKDLSRLQEDKMVADLNLEIQFLLKQGQVEVAMGNFVPDFSDSVLVHRNQIEELNSQIKTLGEAKLNSMLECKDFKRGIRMLEWEHRKMHMEADDLVEKGREVQIMRVTKDLLQRLHEKDLFLKDIREKDTLDKTIEFNKKTVHKVLRNKSKALKNISEHVKSREVKNKELDYKVRDLQVSVTERAYIENLAGVPPSEASRSKKMEDILARRRLVEAIKVQDEEYSVLKAEMERLRMRTFPALVQVD